MSSCILHVVQEPGVKNGNDKKEEDGKTRVLVGVMRVGLLAKQLLLK